MDTQCRALAQIVEFYVFVAFVKVGTFILFYRNGYNKDLKGVKVGISLSTSAFVKTAPTTYSYILQGTLRREKAGGDSVF